MNRARPGGPSKASASTVCQKCLKRGHYSYECSAAQQERPYVSRPSRTQQLLNPKLAPKITETVLKLDDKQASRGRDAIDSSTRGRKHNPNDRHGSRARSISSHSSDSVSSISTNNSRSRSVRAGSERRSPRARERSSQGRHDRSARQVKSYRERSGSPDSSKRDRSRSPTNSRDMHRSGHPTEKRESRPYPRHSISDNERDSSDTGGHSRQQERQKRSISPYSRRQALAE